MPRVYTSRLRALGLEGALAELYAKFVIQRGPAECWGWSGARVLGYGVMHVWGDRMRRAHRYAYELAYGPVPAGCDVMHRCHNPECTNPAHLIAGTRSENQRMSRIAGRWPTKIPYGDLGSIRAQRQTGISLATIGKQYGCSKQAVRMFLRTWGM